MVFDTVRLGLATAIAEQTEPMATLAKETQEPIPVQSVPGSRLTNPDISDLAIIAAALAWVVRSTLPNIISNAIEGNKARRDAKIESQDLLLKSILADREKSQTLQEEQLHLLRDSLEQQQQTSQLVANMVQNQSEMLVHLQAEVGILAKQIVTIADTIAALQESQCKN